MSLRVSVATLCLALLGCGSSRRTLVVSAASATVATGGFMVVIGTEEKAAGFAIGVGATVVALVTFVVGAYKAEVTEAPRSVEQVAALQARQRQDEAWTLTKQAAAAARAGDCSTVNGLDVRVRALDSSFRDVVFARDAAIRACLGTNRD